MTIFWYDISLFRYYLSCPIIIIVFFSSFFSVFWVQLCTSDSSIRSDDLRAKFTYDVFRSSHWQCGSHWILLLLRNPVVFLHFLHP